MPNKVYTNAAADFLWSTAGNWSPSGVPVDDDKVSFVREYNFPVNGSDQSGVDLDLLWVQRGYTANIASSGTPLRIAADLVLYEGDGDFYYHSDLNGGDALKTDTVIIKAGSLSKIIELGSWSGDLGEIDNIYIVRGKVQFTSTLTGINRLEIGTVNGNQSDVQLTINDNANTIALAIAHGGQIVDARVPVTDLYVNGNAVWTHNARAVANLNMGGSGYFVYNTNSTITRATMFDASTLDAMQSYNTSAGTNPVKTVSELIRVGQATRLLAPADTNLFTVTTRRDVRDFN